MNIRQLVRTALCAMFVCVISALAWSGSAAAQSAAASDLSARISAKDPLHAQVRLTNISASSCQVATTAVGTIAITRLTQNGAVVQPLASDMASDEDIGYVLQDQLRTLAPGQSVDIPFEVYSLHSGVVLRTVTWSADGGAYGVEYPIQKTGALQVELNYNLPIAPATGARACAGVFAVTAKGSSSNWLLSIAIAVGILLLILIIILLWRKRARLPKPAVAAAIVLLGLFLWWYRSPIANADVVVPPELQSTYDGCVSVFNANRDITGPVLDILNNPANHFEIVHTHGVGSDMTGMRNPSGTGGIFRIYWNPDDHHRYAGTGGSPDPCTVLYHELYHALDQLNGTFSRDDCAGSGIETKEVMATRAQNQLRVRLGLPPRSHYGDRPLPTGDCRAPGPRPASCTGESCGETNGDPHLRTFDGLRYDFQAAGEFTVARDQSGVFEVQTRQQPWSNSRYVAINTALAFRINGDRVEARAGDSITLLVNGKTQPLAAQTLPGGGKLDVVEGSLQLTWKDGTVAYVRPVGGYGVALSLQLADGLRGKVQGLLGDADGQSGNDLHARSDSTTIKPTFAALYPKFADSWRITSATSLFTYDPGKTTASYTIRNFPDDPGNIQALPGYAAAERFCKSLGISDPTILANCAMDVAITGRPEFAVAAAHSQSFASADASGTVWHLHIGAPGGTATETFNGTAGQKIFIDIPQATLADQCGGVRLLAPDGSEVANGCIINGKGYIDGAVLPATGTYTFSLESDGPAGDATARLLHIQDQTAAIAPDGQPVTARIDLPGEVSRLTFTAQANQHMYVDVPTSTLPSQCGGLRLLGPDGTGVADGCIINGAGYIDTAVAPATGQYTIVVDPNGTDIGQATVHVIFPTAATQDISVNGAAQTVNLAKPGSTATFTFNGTAGQRIFVDISRSDLPSECGLLVLHAPDGSAIGNGCIINHKGNLADDGVVLPATGPYNLVLDPGAASTGATTLLVRDH